MKKRWKKAMSIMLVAIMVAIQQPILAATKTDTLRIGLTTEFATKSSLKVSDSKILIGYSVTNQYKTLATLSSTNGFTFIPTSKYFAKSTQTYDSYEEAKMMADSLRKNYNIIAYVGFFNSESISIVIGETGSSSTLKTIMNQVKGAFGLSFESLGADNGHRVKLTGSEDTILYDGSEENGYPQVAPVSKNEAGDKVLTLGSKSYRGRLEIGRYGSTSVTAVNVIPIDDYLYGEVPAEMVSSWHEEALKAQAVVARTYAANKGGFASDSNSSKPYILNDTTSSQVYKGYQIEEQSTNQAVDATKGTYIYYKDSLIDATFFSTSGGATASCDEVWAGDVAYLKSVPDIYELEPEKKPWIMTFTNEMIQAKLSAQGKSVGTVQSLIEDMRSNSNRLYSLKIKGSSGTLTLQKSAVRSYFGTYSTKFKVIKAGDVPDKVTVLSGNGKQTTKRIQSSYILSANGTTKGSDTDNEQFIVMGSNNLSNYPKNAPQKVGTYYFAGMGYGHGVGMSQSGANGMAKAGYTYEEIIKHYYSGVEVK